jgi:hypothetical protein
MRPATRWGSAVFRNLVRLWTARAGFEFRLPPSCQRSARFAPSTPSRLEADCRYVEICPRSTPRESCANSRADGVIRCSTRLAFGPCEERPTSMGNV